MDTYHVQTAIGVIGFQVSSFPVGVDKAFHALIEKLPDGKSRSYYGLSNMDANGNVLYYAAAEEKTPGEGEKYGYQRYTIPAGNYLSETLHNWVTQTDCIKDIFHKMMQDEKADLSKQCIEWYKSDQEMVCLLQMK